VREIHNAQTILASNNLSIDLQIYDFMNTQLTYNQTYAFRLPPSYIDQARALADFHEDGVFSDAQANGIGNSAFIFYFF
jgi:hypothetical protein